MFINRVVRLLVLPLLVFAIIEGWANAQTTGAIRGTVRDVNAQPLPGVNVSARNTQTGTTYQAVTNASGIYQISSVPVESYDVTVSIPGYGSQTKSCTVTAGQTTTVDFVFGTCTYSISPTSASVGPAAGTGSVSVTAPALCSWTATSNASWITITSGSSGSGNGTVGYQYSGNTTRSTRSGTLTVAQNTFTLSQTGDTTPPVVTITSPTSSPTYATSSSTLNIAGTASDNVSVAAVTWSNNRGGSGRATGTTSWSVPGITLQPGSNVLTVTASDYAENTSSDTLTVDYSLPVPILNSVNPTETYAGGSGFVLTASGSNFVSTSVVQWNGASRTTTYVNSGTLQASISANDIASPGTASVTVYTPAPGGGTSSARTFTINARVPELRSISPTSVEAGGSGFVLTASGSHFVSSSVVQWNGASRPTTYVNSGTLQASIGAADIATPTTARITVYTPPPGGGTSGGLDLTVYRPCTYAIDPTSRSHGPGAETGTVAVTTQAGCPWLASSNASWAVVVSGSSGSGSGTVSYTVAANSAPQSRVATLVIAGQEFAVLQAAVVVPVISSLQPAQVTAGGPAFALTLSGSSFASGSVVRWEGLDRPTTFLSGTQLRASIAAADITATGSRAVTVVNPGGSTSVPKYLTVTAANNPVPTVTRLSPEAMLQGSAGFQLSVVGSNFVPGSKVRWNGEERGTSFESSTMLTAVIPASDAAAAGEASVTVWNPSPGGGQSNGATFRVLSGTVITDLSPSAVPPAGRSFRLTVYGRNFFAGSGSPSNGPAPRQSGGSPAVLWNGQPVTTVPVSSTELQAEIPGNLVGGQSATVSVSGGAGGGASNMVPVPITTTVPAPQLAELSPKSAIPGSGQVTLTVAGKDFAESARVLWNGEARATTFIDSTRLQAVIPAADIASPGAARVSVSNPAPGGGESNGQLFGHMPVLLYPRLASKGRTAGSGFDDSEFTGIAFTNVGTADAAVTFTAFDKSGAALAGTGVTNPKVVPIGAGRQLPVIDYQIFGSGLGALNPLGWFRMESSASGLLGFFLMFNETLSILDGTDVSSRTAVSYVLPEIEAGGFTQVHAVNPDVQPAEVLFELVGADGVVRASATRTVVPSAAAVERLTELFPGISAEGSFYVRVVSNRGIVLFEYLGKAEKYVEGLNGQDAEGGATVLYSPQYAVGGGDWWTALSVVNLEDRPGVVTLRLIGDNGVQLGNTVTRTLAARGKLRIEEQDIFVAAGSGLTQGYVKVESDGIRLAGSVVFGDPARSRFASALPLVGRMKTDMVFSQLVSNETYFTGLAILNPSATPVTVQIDVYDDQGRVLASKSETIDPGKRVSQLVYQYFRQLEGQNYGAGYIRVRSSAGVASFALFGTNSLSALSAVPAQDRP